MNPTTKRLLAKEKLSGKDIGRLLIANLIDIYNDEGLPHEKIQELMDSLETEKDRIDYALYRQAFFALDEARDFCAEIMEKARVACAGLELFYESVFFANEVYPDCRWEKYRLGKMSSETLGTGAFLWCRLNNSLELTHAIRGAIKAAGAWLKIPKLEKILLNDKCLRNEVNALACFTEDIIYSFKKLELPKKLKDKVDDIFCPIFYEVGEPTKEKINELKNMFKLPTFDINLEEAISVLQPSYREYDEEA